MASHYLKAVMAYIEEGYAPHLTSLTSGRYQVTYIPGEWIWPIRPDSKLFVFPSLITAVEFVTSMGTRYSIPRTLPFTGVMLWWCMAKGINKPEQPVFRDLSDKLIEQYWNEYPYFSIDIPRAYQYPWGVTTTLFADQVQLVHPITDKELRRIIR